MYVSVRFFLFCDKILEGNKLKGGVVYFGPWFQRFKSMVSLLHYYGPMVRQSIMVAGSLGKAKLLTQ
jgi:hypothetical protein